MHIDILVCAKRIGHQIIRPCVYDSGTTRLSSPVFVGGTFIDSVSFLRTCNFVAMVSVVSTTRSDTVCHVCLICTYGLSESSDLCSQSKNLGIFGINFIIFFESNYIVLFRASCSRKIIMQHMIVQYYT